MTARYGIQVYDLLLKKEKKRKDNMTKSLGGTYLGNSVQKSELIQVSPESIRGERWIPKWIYPSFHS